MKRVSIAIALVMAILLAGCNLEMIDQPIFDQVDEEYPQGEDIGFEGGMGTEANPYVVNDAESLLKIGTMAGSSDRTIYAKLNADISLQIDASQEDYGVFTVPAGGSVVLDFAGHEVSASAPHMELGSTSGDRSQVLFNIYGRLILNDSVGGGQLGGNYTDNPSSRSIRAGGNGYLEINDGLMVQSFSTSQGSTVWIGDEATAIINDASIFSTYYALASETDSGVIVNGATIASVASNALTKANSIPFAYAITSPGKITINNATVYGIQGAISVSGQGELNDGTESVVSATEIWEVVPEGFRQFYDDYKSDSSPDDIQKSEMFYAVYCAGEYSTEARLVINGGSFRSEGYNTVYVGNSKDGGEGHEANVTIYGGTFTGNVVNDDSNPQYGFGSLSIEGGRFSIDTNLDDFIDSNRFQIVESGDWYEVVPKGDVTDTWQGTIDTDWYDPENKKDSYVIYTAEELAGLAYIVNSDADEFDGVTFRLAADLDLNNIEWTPIGNIYTGPDGNAIYKEGDESFKGFAGTFDGQDHVISNLSILREIKDSGELIYNNCFLGLFGILEREATVRNLTIDNVHIEGEGHIGAVAGHTASSSTSANSNIVLENISVTGDIQLKGKFCVGGILGRQEEAKTTLVMRDCLVLGDEGSCIASAIEEAPAYVSNGYIGGMVGAAYSNVSSLFESCVVENIDVEGKYIGIGGFAGNVNKAEFTDCRIADVAVSSVYDPFFAATLSGALSGMAINGSAVTVDEASIDFDNVTVEYPFAEGSTTIYCKGIFGMNSTGGNPNVPESVYDGIDTTGLHLVFNPVAQ